MIWHERTSASPIHWSEERPALGQCAVTALLIQDLFGGTLERVVVDDNDARVSGSHYFNSVEGIYVDLTASQFSEDATQEGPIEERSRQYVLSYPETREHYRQLLLAANARIAECLNQLEEYDG